jgi:hypothetical protein
MRPQIPPTPELTETQRISIERLAGVLDNLFAGFCENDKDLFWCLEVQDIVRILTAFKLGAAREGREVSAEDIYDVIKWANKVEMEHIILTAVTNELVLLSFGDDGELTFLPTKEMKEVVDGLDNPESSCSDSSY